MLVKGGANAPVEHNRDTPLAQAPLTRAARPALKTDRLDNVKTKLAQEKRVSLPAPDEPPHSAEHAAALADVTRHMVVGESGQAHVPLNAEHLGELALKVLGVSAEALDAAESARHDALLGDQSVHERNERLLHKARALNERHAARLQDSAQEETHLAKAVEMNALITHALPDLGDLKRNQSHVFQLDPSLSSDPDDLLPNLLALIGLIRGGGASGLVDAMQRLQSTIKMMGDLNVSRTAVHAASLTRTQDSGTITARAITGVGQRRS